jgi:hypothetical protein
MSKLFYWQSWERPYRFIFWVLLTIFFTLAIAILSIEILGAESLLDWHVLTYESSYAIDYSIFSQGPFSFSISADKKVLSELFAGAEMPNTTLVTKVLFALIVTAVLLYLTLVTMLKRFWYLIGMGGMLIFLLLLDIGVVQLFGWSDTKVLILIFIILLTPSYYLHAFNTKAGLIKRLWVMAAALAIIGGAIYYFSDTEYPFTTLVNYGVLAPHILIILFIISVAHEIVAFFVNLITSTEDIANKTKLRHFLIITVIYIANILVMYLHSARYIDWQLISINPFVLLVISAVLGIWGSNSRASLYVGASKREALWPILYMIIAIVSMATLIFYMLALNDPPLRVLGDIIIYAHLAIGIAFLLYVLYNFIPLIEKGYKVSKVLYKPKNLPYFTYRLMGIIIVVALFAIRGFDYPVWFSLGGYNNAKGDMALEKGYIDVAEAYYSNGDAFAFHNHKSNYSLGMMYAAKDPELAIEYFGLAMDQRPTSQAVMNKANLQNLQREYYNALFTLQEGNENLKDNIHLYNNLALQFEKVKIIDSATYYFELAGTRNKQIKNNRLGHSARYNRPLGKDSLAIYKNLDRAGKANASALGYIEEIPSMITANHMFDMVLLNNWLLSNAPQVEDGSLKFVKVAIDSTSDEAYKHQLLHSWALAAYSAGNMASAIKALENLVFNSSQWSDRAKRDLAKIYLGLDSYEQASDIFLELNSGQLTLELAISYLENGDPEKALSFWQEAANVDEEFLSTIASDILATIYAEEPELNSDQKRYLYARYSRFFIDESAENETLKLIENLDLRIDLALELAEFYHEFDNKSGAALMLANIDGLSLSREQYRRYILLDALINPDSENVQQQLAEFDTLYSFNTNEYLYENLLNHLAGMTLDSTSYLQMAQDNPFFPDAILASISYFDTDNDPFRSYSFLANAVQLNPESPRLMKAFILKALDVGLEQFAENALFEYGQRFSGQSYIILQNDYDKKLAELRNLEESEPFE